MANYCLCDKFFSSWKPIIFQAFNWKSRFDTLKPTARHLVRYWLAVTVEYCMFQENSFKFCCRLKDLESMILSSSSSLHECCLWFWGFVWGFVLQLWGFVFFELTLWVAFVVSAFSFLSYLSFLYFLFVQQ